ncbi:MAG: hypothetical protein ACJ780_03670 [Solirubrobacteraceae bacterium]
MRFVASSLALVAALALASAASAATLPGVVADGGTPQRGKTVLVRPAQIVYTGDGSGFLAGTGTSGRRPKFGRLKWTEWTGTAALGSGADWLNNCEPFCAAGSFSQHPVDIKLYRPRRMVGLEVFTRMTIHYTAKANPYTHNRVETFTLSRSGRLLFWNISG